MVGAKVQFINKLVKNAETKVIPAPGSSPFLSTLSTPDPNTEKINVMTIPKKPQMITLQIKPGAFFHFLVDNLTTSISPMVAKIPNLINPLIKGCAVVKSTNITCVVGYRTNATNATRIAPQIKSPFFKMSPLLNLHIFYYNRFRTPFQRTS